MTVVDKADRPFSRNLLSGLFGLAAAAVFIAMVLSRRDSLDPTLLILSIYAFPLPVAIGIAAGLVAPRKAIVWAPLWACIITTLALTLLSSEIGAGRIEPNAWRVVFMALGVIISGLGGLLGELANKRGYAWQSAVLITLACIAMLLLVQWSAAGREHAFEESGLPRVVAVLDRDYISAPHHLDWRFKRDTKLDEYILKTRINGQPLQVMASTKETKILGVVYELDGSGQNIKDCENAKAYLKQCGFRNKLLASLAKQSGARDFYCASLEGTRLTLSNTGDVKLEAFQNPKTQLPTRH